MQAWKGISLYINNFPHTTNRFIIVTFLYLVQVKAVLFSVISVSSYYCFLGSTTFKIAQSIQLIHKNAGIHRIDLAAMKRPAG